MPPVPSDLPVLTLNPKDIDSVSLTPSRSSHRMRMSRSAMSLRISRPSTASSFGGTAKSLSNTMDSAVKHQGRDIVCSLQDNSSISIVEDLVLRHGRVAHMGARDSSYRFWMNDTRTAAVHFKVLNKVAVLGGDPLCHPTRVLLTLTEFANFCKKVGWKTAIIGGSSQIAEIAKQEGWTCMKFGTESVLNPQTNEVLLGKSGKRIITQCKQLLDPITGGISVHTYSPAHGRDQALEWDLCSLYDDWRDERNSTKESQAFVTVFDLFALPSLMIFLYTRDRAGRINGFAALRRLGAVEGYHADPFIQTSSAPRGVSDLLILSALALLNVQRCTYLSLGYEPVTELSEICGLPSILHSTTKKVYKHLFGKIPVGGKEAFHARWRPVHSQATALYLVFVGKIPSPRYMLAMTHFANISLRRIIASDWQAMRAKKEVNGAQTDEIQHRKQHLGDMMNAHSVAEVLSVEALSAKTATMMEAHKTKINAVAITLSERPCTCDGLQRG